MRSNRPPRFATWLLERLALNEKRESLIGDLLEQYLNGRSASWYWRQALYSILVGAKAGIRNHKVLAVRAVLIGFASMWVFGAIARVSLQVIWALASGGVYLGNHWVRLDYGWIRHSIHLGLLMTVLASTLSGWIVGRTHRDHETPMVFAFLVSVVVAALVQVATLVRLVGWSIRPLAQHPLIFALSFLAIPACILFGGLMSLRPVAAFFQLHPIAAATSAGRASRDEDS
jgi:hypothetical protein